MKYTTFKSITNDISELSNKIIYINKTILNIETLMDMGYLNASGTTNELFNDLKSVIKEIEEIRETERKKIIDYNFLNHHLMFSVDDKKWLGMNGDTKISKSYSCAHCNSNNHKDEHICATELISPSECGSMEGGLFLEKMKCSSCNEEYIVQNGV